MLEYSTDDGLIQRVKILENRVARANLKIERLKSSRAGLATVLANVPLFIMLVDQDRRVINVSDAVLQFSGKGVEEIIGQRPGEVLRCIHHLDDPKGCGYGSECGACLVRNTVQDTLDTGTSHSKVEAKLSLAGEFPEERTLLLSTAMIEVPGKKAIVFIEDITDRKQTEKALLREKERLQDSLAKINKLSGLLPICASCKKIRDDKGYWSQIEFYIRDHSEAEFSHGICPECAKKLYPDVDMDD